MAFGFGGGGGEGGGSTISVSAVVSACIAAVSLGAGPANAPAATLAPAASSLDSGPAFQGTEVTVAPPTGPSI